MGDCARWSNEVIVPNSPGAMGVVVKTFHVIILLY